MTTQLEAPRTLRPGRRSRHRRSTGVTVVLAASVLVLLVATLMIGSYAVSVQQVLGSLLSPGSDPAADFIVRDLRLPTAATALGVGIALGVAGTVFQKLLGNPLASPDFVGISSGASMCAVTSIVLVNAGSVAVSGSALAGAVVTAGAIYLLAWRDGISGYRFVLIGIGISQLMLSIIGYIVARADIHEAREAMTWLVGTVGLAGPGELRVLLGAVVLLVPAALLLERPLRALELGDDAATALGARVELSRLGLLALSIVLVGLSVAAAGPIMFVALIAGPIATRLTGPGGSVLASGLVGAVIVLAADLVAQHLVPTALPTGVVTGIIGAPYLIWLLATVNREGRGG